MGYTRVLNILDRSLKQMVVVENNSVVRNYWIMYHNQTKKIVYLSLIGFILAFLSSSYRPYNTFFLLRSCSICKFQTSGAGTQGKYKIKSGPPATIIHISFIEIPLFLSGILPKSKPIHIAFQVAFAYLNKAPPLMS